MEKLWIIHVTIFAAQYLSMSIFKTLSNTCVQIIYETVQYQDMFPITKMVIEFGANAIVFLFYQETGSFILLFMTRQNMLYFVIQLCN